MSTTNIVVLKFGGSVIHSDADFHRIHHEIKRHTSQDHLVVAVVSAFYGVTESLINRAIKNGFKPSSSDYAEQIAKGEFTSANELVSYLNARGSDASRQSPAELEFMAEGARDSGKPIRINAHLINSALSRTPVIVVPGYSAIDSNGDCILLGRGGSDISAVCIAESLGLNSVRLLKDVDGLYDMDPNKHPNATRLDYVNYATAKEIGGELIQTEAIEFAASRGIFIDIAAIGETEVSRIGPIESCAQLVDVAPLSSEANVA